MRQQETWLQYHEREASEERYVRKQTRRERCEEYGSYEFQNQEHERYDMDIMSTFASSYLKCSDLQGREAAVAIGNIAIEKINEESKPVLYFVGKTMGFVLNKTNANTICSMYGPETDAWIGKTITLWPTQTDYKGETVPCIRIKLQNTQTSVSTDLNVPLQAPTANPTVSVDDGSIPF